MLWGRNTQRCKEKMYSMTLNKNRWKLYISKCLKTNRLNINEVNEPKYVIEEMNP